MSFSKGNTLKPTSADMFIQQEILASTSTPDKRQTIHEDFENRLQHLKQKVSDTLTFLHQERNDFLPQEDIIIPSRKDDHVSKEIDLDSIRKEAKKPEEIAKVQNIAESEVSVVIKRAEDVVNELKTSSADLTNKVAEISQDLDFIKTEFTNEIENDTNKILNELSGEKAILDNSNDLQLKSEEVFKFLENEASSPTTPLKPDFDLSIDLTPEKHSFADSNKVVTFQSPESPTKIPIAKPRQLESKQKEKDFYLGDITVSPTDSELLSKIPVSSKGKVKTIKKHSKDPLKEFVTLSKDVNWDDADTEVVVTSDPIVKTTVTRITSVASPEATRSKIPVLHTEALSPKELSEKFDLSQKSKIPVLQSETTTRMTSPDSIKSYDSNLVSPASDARYSNKSSTLDSDSETDSRRSPPLKGILKKTAFRTVGSSSGSDVALHEAGAESSDDESGT